MGKGKNKKRLRATKFTEPVRRKIRRMSQELRKSEKKREKLLRRDKSNDRGKRRFFTLDSPDELALRAHIGRLKHRLKELGA
jgi:hypothetical protein